MNRFIKYFATGEDKPPFSEDQSVIKKMFEWRRWSVFISVTLGYGIYYVGRLSFSVVKKPMLDEGVMTATQMGIVGSSLLICYAIGKFANGFIADRVNVRRFMSFGLLAVAAINLILGSTTMFAAFVMLWGINGWFQSIGAPASIVTLANWFSPRERGTWYGIWCISHDIGGALTVIGTSVLVAELGWRWGFWGPGILCAVCSLVMLKTLKDRPMTYGLPPVSEYKKDPTPIAGKSASVNELQLEVLKNPAVWALGLASAFMYVTRYGIYNWGVLFFQEGRGYTLGVAGSMLAVLFTASMCGAFLSGIISDVFFKANRSVPCLMFGIIETLCLFGLFWLPPGNMMVDFVLMGLMGASLGVLVSFLGGLMAIDIVPPRAAGAAAGVVGMFSYIGAAIQDTASGVLIDMGKTVSKTSVTICPQACSDIWTSLGSNITSAISPAAFERNYDVIMTTTKYDFDKVMWFWIAASAASVITALLVWKSEKRAHGA
jgi:OPA family sugar phosphate sensor protein UhpC-like MFS transporter